MNDPIQSRSDELRRIDFSGTAWLAAVLVANAVFVAALVVRHWTYALVPPAAALPWWTGVVVSVAATGALAWAGCPVLRQDIERADRRKAITIRFGIVAYLLGAALTVGATLS